MKYRVIITPGAETELRTAYHYIRKRGAPQAARAWLTGVRKKINTLAAHPERAPLAPESTAFHEPIRELLYGSSNRGTYRILFALIDRAVFILHFRHGSMLALEPEESRIRKT